MTEFRTTAVMKADAKVETLAITNMPKMAEKVAADLAVRAAKRQKLRLTQGGEGSAGGKELAVPAASQAHTVLSKWVVVHKTEGEAGGSALDGLGGGGGGSESGVSGGSAPGGFGGGASGGGGGSGPGVSMVSLGSSNNMDHITAQAMNSKAAVKRLAGMGIVCVCPASDAKVPGKKGRPHHSSACTYNAAYRRLVHGHG
mmetsp:Transcript_5898/g.14625  ORF Transcript_5898/g.14625 Transcript_5898/m.14625 type:complete len:200 (-) Transcript_5898:190-789(-)